ncbi:hypothetical protein E4U17_000826 [Claviceps sp. LM77 group G4]|nr:hypothetical protein E4U17_000826 [Claviceps sp. LM77 group G4]KAG6084655.1 hypothetical protein E4U16_001314 [Claviceps sp. LM84 group G4]KAG6086782.1 hypothetical protein E4U33_000024 [Claviceps sp. LM78 group G4]
MSITLQLGDQRIRVTAEPLAQDAFSPFGSVISNSRPDIHPSSAWSCSDNTSSTTNTTSLPANAVFANQGFAIQYRHVAAIKNLYDQAPSGVEATPIMSMFVCSARQLLHTDNDPAHDIFPVRILERHPFTTQTFSPLASTARAYLVIVAPSLPPCEEKARLSVPVGQDLPGRGLPDLRGLRAFVATDAQAVMYGAGTWHAPMVVLGREGTTLDFVVSQYASGVPIEDCQIVELGEGAEVRVPRGWESRDCEDKIEKRRVGNE